MAFIVWMALLFVSCDKEQEPIRQPDTESTNTYLSGTSWGGKYDDNFYVYPATLTWRLDFLTDSTGTLSFFLVIAAQPQLSMTDSFLYSLDGSTGTLYGDNILEPGGFIYDSINHTITMNLQIGDGNVSLGGTTVFHLHEDSCDLFPVNSSWEAEQCVTAND